MLLINKQSVLVYWIFFYQVQYLHGCYSYNSGIQLHLIFMVAMALTARTIFKGQNT